MKLWLVGDSITVGYAPFVEYPDWDVTAYAVGGRTTQQIMDAVLPTLLSTNEPPDVAVVQGGGNDIAASIGRYQELGLWNEETDTPTGPLPTTEPLWTGNVVQRLVQLAGYVESRGGKAILALPVGLPVVDPMVPFATWFQSELTAHRNALCGMPCRAVNLRLKQVSQFATNDPFHPSAHSNETILTPRIVSKVRQVLNEEPYIEACLEE